MLHTISKYKHFATLLLGLIFLVSCKKEDPVPNFANEEYDRLEVLLIPMDNLGHETTDTTRINYDIEGIATPSSSNIVANKTYRMLINTYAHNTLINEEIIQDSTAHKFFFFADPSSAVSDYQYNDGIGLDGKISFAAVSMVAFTLLEPITFTAGSANLFSFAY